MVSVVGSWLLASHTGYPGADRGSHCSQPARWWLMPTVPHGSPLTLPSLLLSSLSSYFLSAPPASFSSFIPSFFPPFFFPQTLNEPLLCSTSGKEPICQCRRHRRLRFSLWVGKIPWSSKCHPLQYPCLFNPMDRGTWQASGHMVAKQSDMTEVTEP